MKLQTIIDNRNSNTVLEALKKILPESQSLDVATGYFEIGSLLALDTYWNNLEKIRIVMGDETTKRTRKELVDALQRVSEESIEKEKEKDDSLRGLHAIRASLDSKQIEAKIYLLAKFHAKALLMQLKPPHLSNYGIIGSSNFTEAGLCRNVELNLLSTEQIQLEAVQNWYNTHWAEAEDVKDEIFKIIQPHIKEYSPYEVYVKALYEYFLGKEVPSSTWEESQSKIYPILDELQQIGYRQALWIAEKWGGALVCDGVGFGKTYIGLMLIERFLHERKRVLLIVPKSARESVWEKRLFEYLPEEYSGPYTGSQLEIINHTDLHREKFEKDLQKIKQRADVIVVDEAHHFRTPNAQRSEKLYELMDHGGNKKQIYMLTATPLNNSLFDILHLIEYFSGKDRKYFQRIGINDTRTYFVKMERAVEEKMGIKRDKEYEEHLFQDYDATEAEKFLKQDVLFKELVIQRSRDYAKKYFAQVSKDSMYFPERDTPAVAEYKLASIYGDLFKKIKSSFSRDNPFLELKLYNPENYRKDETKKDPWISGREAQVISLIRATFLKRMESSYKAFESSCEDLFRKIATFLKNYNPGKWEKWRFKNEKFWDMIEKHWIERFPEKYEESEVEEDDLLPDFEDADRLTQEEFFIETLIESAERDLNELKLFLEFIYQNITERTDDKLHRLLKLLEDDKLKDKKVIIFTEYRDTARYIFKQLKKNKIGGVIEELDSTSSKDREEIIKRFAPYYNCNAAELPRYLNNQIRVLVSTDVLSEGLNLQDANYLINYDLHWNPVRLMQRIGRVDRRLDPNIEKLLGRKNCVVKFWNFLPPDDLDSLLRLYERVSGKVLRISKTLGIEGKQLLTPEDDFEALKDFNVSYNGIMTFEETMRLNYEKLIQDDPELKNLLPKLPRRLFSGKKGKSEETKGLFAAFRMPGTIKEEGEKLPGECRWYFYSEKLNEVIEMTEKIYDVIKADKQTERVVTKSFDELREELKIIERKAIQKQLRDMQAVAGTKAQLVCWMQIA
jgi:superfamily II DNA or RNA helicase